MIATAAGIGFGVGLILGALGGGGSELTVPALVYLLGELPHRAGTASLVIVETSSVTGLLVRTRAGHVRWAHGLGFGAVGVATSVGGTVLGSRLNPHTLMLAFAALILFAAFVMLRRISGPARPPPSCMPARSPPAHRHFTAQTATIVGTGAVAGFATGLFGVGGGFLVVPALVGVLDWPMPTAIGTSLLVIVVNAAASLWVRAATSTFDWKVIIPVSLTAIVGTLLGKSVSDSVSHTFLARAFAVLLVVVAIYTAATSVVALR